MRISRVQIDNYRILKHVDVELGSIVALIGENNSGKSNFFYALFPFHCPLRMVARNDSLGMISIKMRKTSTMSS